MNPPLYGADTPTSLFDEKVPWGWNLRDLGCLLKEYDVPEISGVTSPMTYFGMWKAFFGWHKEDLDLMSVRDPIPYIAKTHKQNHKEFSPNPS